MVTLIDHSAHYIWDYAEYATSRALTENEWQITEYYSVQIAASGPLITLGGSGAADDAWSKNPEWIKYAKSMSEAGIVSLNAANGRRSIDRELPCLS